MGISCEKASGQSSKNLSLAALKKLIFRFTKPKNIQSSRY